MAPLYAFRYQSCRRPGKARAGRVNPEVRELRKHECRRCLSSRLLILEKKRQEDNDVYRCRDCGYLFSPPPSPAAPLRNTAMESGPGGSR
jgi:rubrerythrin